MGFYIRKFVRFGPLRLNLSKSGLGLSAGVKGFRLGTGPRGNYVHVGRGGLYYRQSLNPANSKSTPRRTPLDRQSAAGTTPAVEMHEIESKDVLQIVDANSESLVAEIRNKARIVTIWPWAGAILGGLAAVSAGAYETLGVTLFVLAPVAMVVAALFDKNRKTTVILYDLDTDSEREYSAFFESFERLRSSHRKWHIEAKSDVLDKKYNAGASELVRRNRIQFGTGSPKNIRTNVPVPSIPVGKQRLYFLPDKLLIVENKDAGAVSYATLDVSVASTRFIETEGVPGDAQVVDHTWKYVNKRGGPDKRFKDNVQLPIALYAQVDFASSTGLRERLNVSNVANAEHFGAAIRKLAGYYREIEGIK